MKVTPDHVRSLVVHSQFHRFTGTTTTVCCITLKNGHTAVGKSACADHDEFNADLGQKLAYDDALSKVFAMEGYLLSETLHRERKVTNAEQSFNERSAIISEKPAPRGDFNPMVGAFVEMSEKGRGIESTEEADQDELEWPDLNFGIEAEPIDGFLFSISDEERTMMKRVLAMGGTVIRTDEGEQWKLVGLCDEGAICEYAGEVDE